MSEIFEDNNKSEDLVDELKIDFESRRYLSEASRWGKFLAIVGFIFCGLIVLGGILFAFMVRAIQAQTQTLGGPALPFSEFFLILIYLLIALLYLFPTLYLYKFSKETQAGIANESQASLSDGFKNLKSLFKFMGILTIISIALYLSMLLVTLGLGLISGGL